MAITIEDIEAELAELKQAAREYLQRKREVVTLGGGNADQRYKRSQLTLEELLK